MNTFLSCDWGTSSFRLRLVDVPSREVIREVHSDEGAVVIFNRWLQCCGQQKIGKMIFYLRQLKKSIDGLLETLSPTLSEIPVVISGMASSSIGIRELPYASLPFSLDGSDTIVHRIEPSCDFTHPVWLISGVKHREDVMRGEETQVMGLECLQNEMSKSEEDTICIFPGTHSKHMTIRNGKIIDFKTYVTGELFHVMTNHSILKDSVSSPDNQLSTRAQREAFGHGVRRSGEESLLHTLFTVRVNQLFEYLTKEDNYFYLSGLLIGSEVRTLLLAEGARVMVCSGSNIYHVYELAMLELGLQDRTVFVDPDTMDKAVIKGQTKILLHNTN